MRPPGKLIHRAPMRSLDERLEFDPASIHAVAANTNLVTFGCKEFQHSLDIVVTIGRRLARESTECRIANEKHRYASLFVFGQGTRQPKAVVASLGSVGRIIQNE